jgi:hypothetical protein
MSGFDFVLLAMQGRLREGTLPEDERARIESFLADYWRISRAFHDRKEAPAPMGLAIHGPVVADLPAVAAN